MSLSISSLIGILTFNSFKEMMKPFFCLAFFIFLLNYFVVKEANGSLRELKLYEFKKGLEDKHFQYSSSFIYSSPPSTPPQPSIPTSHSKKVPKIMLIWLSELSLYRYVCYLVEFYNILTTFFFLLVLEWRRCYISNRVWCRSKRNKW